MPEGLPPVEALREIFEIDPTDIPPHPCVYALMSDDQVAYIGSTLDPRWRAYQHASNARSGSHKNDELGALLCEGAEFRVIEDLHGEAADTRAVQNILTRREFYWMLALKPHLNSMAPPAYSISGEMLERARSFSEKDVRDTFLNGLRAVLRYDHDPAGAYAGLRDILLLIFFTQDALDTAGFDVPIDAAASIQRGDVCRILAREQTDRDVAIYAHLEKCFKSVPRVHYSEGLSLFRRKWSSVLEPGIFVAAPHRFLHERLEGLLASLNPSLGLDWSGLGYMVGEIVAPGQPSWPKCIYRRDLPEAQDASFSLFPIERAAPALAASLPKPRHRPQKGLKARVDSGLPRSDGWLGLHRPKSQRPH